MRVSDSCTRFLSVFPQPSHHSESPSLVNFFIVSTTNQFILLIYSFIIRFYILSVLFISSPRIHAFCSPILTYPTSFPHPAPDTPPSFPPHFMPMVAYRPGGTETGAGLHSQYPRRPPTLHPQHPGSGNAPPSCRAPPGAGGSLALPATLGLLAQRQLRFCEGPESGAAGRVSVQTPRGTCKSSDHERCARSRMCGPKEHAGRRGGGRMCLGA